MTTLPTFFFIKCLFIILSFKGLEIIWSYYTLDSKIFDGFFPCVTGQGKEMNPFHFQWTLIFVTTSLNLGIGQGEFKLWWDFPTIVCSILKTFCKVEFKDIRKNLFPFFRPITRGFSLTAGTKSGHSWYWNQTELEGGGGGDYCWSQTVGCPTLLIAWWIVVKQLFSAAGLHLNQSLTFLAKS